MSDLHKQKNQILKKTFSFYVRFSVAKMGNLDEGSVFFLVDGERYAGLDEQSVGADTAAGTATITIELTAGQIVQTENFESTVVVGTVNDLAIFSWFTGHLLYAL